MESLLSSGKLAVPRCDGSYGRMACETMTTTTGGGGCLPSRDDDDDDNVDVPPSPAAAAAATAAIIPSSFPPVEEVMRWKEYRRRHGMPSEASDGKITTKTTTTATIAELIDPLGFPVKNGVEDDATSSTVAGGTPTEITSNTARRVVYEARRAAGKLMSIDDGNGVNDGGGDAGGDGEWADAVPSPTSAHAAVTTNATTPGWDCTRTTLRSEMLEDMLATPGKAEVEEEEYDDDDERCDENVVGDKIDHPTTNIPSSPPNHAMSSSPSSCTLREVDDFMTRLRDRSRVSPHRSVNGPGAGEGGEDGNNVDQIVASSSRRTTSKMPGEEGGKEEEEEKEKVIEQEGGGEEEEEEEEEDAEFVRSLMERRERLRLRKAADEMRKREFVNRIRDMRTRAHEDVGGMDDDGCATPGDPSSHPGGGRIDRHAHGRKPGGMSRSHPPIPQSKIDAAAATRVDGKEDCHSLPTPSVLSRTSGDIRDEGGADGGFERNGKGTGDLDTSAQTKRGDEKDESDPSLCIPPRTKRLAVFGKDSSPLAIDTAIDRTPTRVATREGDIDEWYLTDEKRNDRRMLGEEREVGSHPSFGPFFSGARWSGGSACWNNSQPPVDIVSSSPPPSQPRQEPEKKMNIAVDEDDFSFKPQSIVGAAKYSGVIAMNRIAISPIVTGTVASSRFIFDRSSTKSEKGLAKNSAATIHETMTDAAKFSSSSPASKNSTSTVSHKLRSQHAMQPSDGNSNSANERRASLAVALAQGDDDILVSSTPKNNASRRKSSPSEDFPSPLLDSSKYNSSECSQHEPPSESSFPTGASSSASPDISEGDKGGGVGFGYTAFPNMPTDKSIITTSSSKLVELGQKNAVHDPPEEEGAENDESTTNNIESSLLGVTVVGFKKKRKFKGKRQRLSSPLFETVEEQESICSAHETDSLASKVELQCAESARKQLDPDGFDWKELEAERRAEEASALIYRRQQPQLSVLTEIKKEEFSEVTDRAKKCLTSPGVGRYAVAIEGRMYPSSLNIDVVPENDNNRVEPVINGVKSLTPTEDRSDIMHGTAFFTPKSVQSDASRFVGGKFTRIHELRSKFESSGSVASLKSSSNRLRLKIPSTRQDKSHTMPSPPESADDQDFDWTLSKSSETMSIKERRLIYETGNAATLIGRGVYLKNREIQAMSSMECQSILTKESSINDGTVGDQTSDTKKVMRYVKALELKGHQEVYEIESMLSFESCIEKKDTGNSTKENYLEIKAVDANTAGDTANRNVNLPDFPDFSPVKTRKAAYESKKDQSALLARTVVQAHQQLLKTKPDIMDEHALKSKEGAEGASSHVTCIVSSATTPSHAKSLATSVKDRVAIYSGEKAALVKDRSKNPTKATPQQETSPNRATATLQQQAKISVSPGQIKVAAPMRQQLRSPPRTIAVNRTTDTPSPLWVANQSDALASGYCPNRNNHSKPVCQNYASPNLKPHDFNRVFCGPASTSPHIRQIATRNETNQTAGRNVPVETRYDSPFTRECDDDEEDGITLSPTFSEVSGLTIPTFHGHSSQTPTQPDLLENMHRRNGAFFHETMSPIARHRQQKEKISISNGGAKLSTHPYIQRISAKYPTASIEKPINVNVADFPDEIKTPKARGSPWVGQESPLMSRREQLVSRVRASPRNLNSKPIPSKARSQDRPARNVSSSRSYPSKTTKTSGREWQERNMIPENCVKTSNDQGKANNRVIKSVNKVSGGISKSGNNSNLQHQYEKPYRRSGNYGNVQRDDQRDSITTLDCIRVD